MPPQSASGLHRRNPCFLFPPSLVLFSSTCDILVQVTGQSSTHWACGCTVTSPSLFVARQNDHVNFTHRKTTVYDDHSLSQERQPSCIACCKHTRAREWPHWHVVNHGVSDSWPTASWQAAKLHLVHPWETNNLTATLQQRELLGSYVASQR